MAALQHSVRANVINELVTAERDYVKLLSDLVDGYLKPMKSRPDLFTPQRIQSIFGNLEELYRFQKSFLVDLEHSLNWNALEDSVVGGCFLQHVITPGHLRYERFKIQRFNVSTVITDPRVRYLRHLLQ